MSKFPAELEAALTSVSKQWGKGSIFQLGGSDALSVDVIPSGIPELDKALGVGGFPKGRITEIFGPEAGGKTTLTLHIIAQAQKLGGRCFFVDAEHSFDPTYARALGVDTDSLWITQPDYGEQALEIAESMIKSEAISVVVVDSVAALVPKAELEGDMGQAQMGLQARLLSQAMRKLTAVTAKSNTLLVFINQIREKFVLFGSPETTSGGRALKFYSTIRLDIRRIGAIKKGEDTTGAKTKIKIVKNKLAPPYKEIELKLEYGKGFLNA